MTAIISTIGMAVTRCAALMTMRNNFVRDPLAHPLVKNKIFTNKADSANLVHAPYERIQ